MSTDTLNSSVLDREVRFVDVIDSQYECTVCMCVADDHVGCGRPEGCSGTYCNSCLRQEFENKKGCPSCRFQATGPIKQLQIKRQIEKFPVYCINNSTNSSVDTKENNSTTANKKRKADELNACCSWQGHYYNLESHLKDCLFVTVACPFEGCGDSFQRCDLDAHKATCAFRTEICVNCSKEILSSGMDSHVDVCPKVMIECPNKCGVQEMERGDSLRHLNQDCSEGHVV